MTRTRIARAAAVVASGAAALGGLGITPAWAEKSPTHWTIDRDKVQLSPSGSTFRFDGTMEHFDDGDHVRSVLTGQFAGTDDVEVLWSFRDCDQFVEGFSGGSARTLTFSSADVAPKCDVVRAEVFYFRGTSQESRLFYVGDAPDSLGTCDRLDQDQMNIGVSPNPRVEGVVRWSCVNRNEVLATVDTRLVAGSGRTIMRIAFRYADGTESVQTVSPIQEGTYPVLRSSDAGKRARSVTVRLSYGRTVSERTVNFGDDA